jgi:uncharacterized protein (DUF1697 family)
MTVFVALLRAINVGGTGALPMIELRSICAQLGYGNPLTYIQSGNVVFDSAESEAEVRDRLQAALGVRAGRPVDVVVRSAAELERIARANPFPEADGAKVAVVLGQHLVPEDLDIAAPGGERVVIGARELYVHYPDGLGRSKLKFPESLGVVTTRNMNTVAKLVALARS